MKLHAPPCEVLGRFKTTPSGVLGRFGIKYDLRVVGQTLTTCTNGGGGVVIVGGFAPNTDSEVSEISSQIESVL